MMTTAKHPEFPASASDVNWEMLQKLYVKPHPLVNNTWEPPDPDTHYAGEMFSEIKATHHLLDLVGVPHGYGADTRDIDTRVLIAVIGIGKLREQLARISGWHARETGPGGMVGDFCIECGHRWPCDTRQMADGAYREGDDNDCG